MKAGTRPALARSYWRRSRRPHADAGAGRSGKPLFPQTGSSCRCPSQRTTRPAPRNSTRTNLRCHGTRQTAARPTLRDGQSGRESGSAFMAFVPRLIGPSGKGTAAVQGSLRPCRVVPRHVVSSSACLSRQCAGYRLTHDPLAHLPAVRATFRSAVRRQTNVPFRPFALVGPCGSMHGLSLRPVFVRASATLRSSHGSHAPCRGSGKPASSARALIARRLAGRTH